MSDDGTGFFVGMVISGIVFGLVMGQCTVPKTKLDELKAKAVETGSAEWKVDSKTGQTEFTWKEPSPTTPNR